MSADDRQARRDVAAWVFIAIVAALVTGIVSVRAETPPGAHFVPVSRIRTGAP